jgi:hypothetical protein
MWKSRTVGGCVVGAAATIVAFQVWSADAQVPLPDDLVSLYSENAPFIRSQISIAEDRAQPAGRRIDAFDLISVRFPRAALDPAIRLATDASTEVAADALRFLSAVVVMHGPSPAATADDPAAKAIGALRRAVTDERQQIREIAAVALSSSNDESTIATLKQAYDGGKISESEAIRYMTLAKTSVAGKYVADFLENGNASLNSKSEAIAYLGTNSDYRAKIRDSYLQNNSAPVELRSAAAQVLAKSDPAFGSYAAALVADPSLPTPVFTGVVNNLNARLPAAVVQEVLTKAVESQVNNQSKDSAKTEALSNSVKRVQALRPDVRFDGISAAMRALEP